MAGGGPRWEDGLQTVGLGVRRDLPTVALCLTRGVALMVNIPIRGGANAEEPSWGARRGLQSWGALPHCIALLAEEAARWAKCGRTPAFVVTRVLSTRQVLTSHAY